MTTKRVEVQDTQLKFAQKLQASGHVTQNYKKFGYLAMEVIGNEEKSCAKCKKSLQRDAKVWSNEFGRVQCFDCQPVSFELEQLQKHEKVEAERQDLLPTFEAIDRTRVDSVLNTNGSSLSYKN